MLIRDQMQQLDRFSHHEQISIAFIKAHGSTLSSYSARQKARETLTSPATVVRL